MIGVPTYERPDLYTVFFPDGSLAEYTNDMNILELLPDTVAQISDPLLPSWIQGGVNATLFLQSMTTPRHGKLFQNSQQLWGFCLGTLVDPE